MVEFAHAVPMLSLEKATTPAAVVSFFGEAVAGVVEPKVDGLSLAARFVNGRLVQALTRGDGRKGSDVTANVRTIRNFPIVLRKPLTLEVRGEVYIRHSHFSAWNEQLIAEGETPAANPRNAAVGALRLLHSAECAKVPLSFMACGTPTVIEGYSEHVAVLELLEECGFATTSGLPLPVKECLSMYQRAVDLGDEKELAELIVQLEQSRRYQDFPTDGLVFKINALALQHELGSTHTAPRYMLAFKYPPEQAETELMRVEFTVGKTGKITPVGHFQPVRLSGSTVAKASLCNGDELARLRLGVGDRVVLEKSNEIIPKVMRVAKLSAQPRLKMPEACPACGQPLQRTEGFVDVYCVNPVCPAQAKARLTFALSKHALDMDGCGEKAVEQLVEHGIVSLADLLAAKSFPFLKPVAGKKLLAGVQQAMQVPLWRKLAALNIEGWGKTTCMEMATQYSDVLALYDAVEKDSTLPILKRRFAAQKAESFLQFFKVHQELVVRLDNLGFFAPAAEERIENPKIAGKTFCITGSLPGVSDRHLAEEEIRKRGGAAKGSVGRKLDYLVVGESPGDTKLRAALHWNTKRLTPEEFFALMEWQPSCPQRDPEHEY
jgi:DNA ligase (NAD+)